MKKRTALLIILSLITLALTGCQPDPSDVALKLAEATNAQDMEAAIALFADDAVVISVSPQPFTGKAEIQGWLGGMFADNFTIETKIVEVNGDVLIEKDTVSMDSMKFYGIDTLTGTSEVTVQGGLIKTLNFSFSDETLADMGAAPFVSPDDIVGIWSVGTFIQFNEDGTLRVADKLADLTEPVDEDHPGSFEKWTYDGMVITFQAVETGVGAMNPCTPDQVGVFFVKWAGENLDRLKFMAIDDPCFARIGFFFYQKLSNSPPTSAILKTGPSTHTSFSPRLQRPHLPMPQCMRASRVT